MQAAPFASILRALGLRDFSLRALAPSATAACATGVIAGWIAGGLPALSSGSVNMLIEFDRTIAGVYVVIAVFGLIRRMHGDVTADWLMQLIAGGLSRIEYMAALALAVITFHLMLYVLTISTFGITSIMRGAGPAALERIPGDTIAGAIMTTAATCFATAACTALRRSASTFAAAAIALPWLLLWFSIIVRSAFDVPITVIRVLGALSPRVFVDLSLRGSAHQLIYIALTAGIAILFGNASIARAP